MNKAVIVTAGALVAVSAGAVAFAASAANQSTPSPAAVAAAPGDDMAPVAEAQSIASQIVMPACNADGSIPASNEAVSGAAVVQATSALHVLGLQPAEIASIGMGTDCKLSLTLVPDLAANAETIGDVKLVLGANLGRIGFGSQGDVK